MIQEEKDGPEGKHLICHYCCSGYSHSLDACGAIDVPSAPYEGTNLCPKGFAARLGGVKHPEGLCQHSLIPALKLIRFPLRPHAQGAFPSPGAVQTPALVLRDVEPPQTPRRGLRCRGEGAGRESASPQSPS